MNDDEGIDGGHRLLAVVAGLDGTTDTGVLEDSGAHHLGRTTTAARYRLYRLAGLAPHRRALDRVGPSCGRAVEVDLWSIDVAGLGLVAAELGPPLGLGNVELADGRWVKGLICEARGLADAEDITARSLRPVGAHPVR